MNNTREVVAMEYHKWSAIPVERYGVFVSFNPRFYLVYSVCVPAIEDRSIFGVKMNKIGRYVCSIRIFAMFSPDILDYLNFTEVLFEFARIDAVPKPFAVGDLKQIVKVVYEYIRRICDYIKLDILLVAV